MMGRFVVTVTAAASLAAPHSAEAFHPLPDEGAERPLTADGIALRTHRNVVYERAPAPARAAWQAFVAEHPGAWQASWDVATGVPSRLFGDGIPAPGSVESPRAAEAAARRVLREHIALLAPGSDPQDFAVVANKRDGGLRSVGFAQSHDGLRVVGGQVTFRFKRDRLFVIGSEALPHVSVERDGPTLPEAAARRSAAEITGAREPGASDPAGGDVEGPVILPLVGARGVHGYRVAMEVDVAGRDLGSRWQVYVDAASGAFLARQRRAHPTTATVHFDAPIRRPGGERDSFPARNAHIVVNGRTTETSESGLVVWFDDDEEAELTLRPEGSAVQLQDASGSLAELSTTLSSGTSHVWDERDDEFVDAQLSAFVHAQIAADRARALTSNAAWLDEELAVNVNLDGACNAFFDQNAKSLNFFQSNEECANTARLPDVVYHEFGHLLHVQSISSGVGQFDGALSEGASDYFAALVTGDTGVGRGFFYDEQPLREIDPDGNERPMWPEDIGDVHTTGLIFSGAMWKLREELIEKHGAQEGAAVADDLYYAALRRSTDIPSSYIEVLAADDEDGDISNGTPNICAINRAFGAHGLRLLRSQVDDLGAERVSEEGHRVGFRLHGVYDQCESDQIESAEIVWRHRGGGDENRVAMSSDGESYAGRIPPQAHDTPIRYYFDITFVDGGRRRIPRNPADPWFALYVGDTVPLYCTDFEDTSPFKEGWTRGALHGSNDWEWNAPAGNADDPPFAYTGEQIIGNNLGESDSAGAYPTDSINFVRSPAIEVGDFTNVRIQYRRWLNVEDGYYDKASILANDEVIWQNADSDQGISSNTHHRDQRWRFHDAPLVPVMHSDSVQITFKLESDGGLEFGGWNVDDVCVVADPDSVCGDNVVTGFEACDDGEENSDVHPDACRTSCLPARCGDGVLDSDEACDPGRPGGLPCTDSCRIIGGRGGCHCQAGGSGGPLAGPLLLAIAGGLILVRIRRRGRA